MDDDSKAVIASLQAQVARMQTTMDFQNQTIHMLEAELTALRRSMHSKDACMGTDDSIASAPAAQDVASASKRPTTQPSTTSRTGLTGRSRAHGLSKEQEERLSYSARSSFESLDSSSPQHQLPADAMTPPLAPPTFGTKQFYTAVSRNATVRPNSAYGSPLSRSWHPPASPRTSERERRVTNDRQQATHEFKNLSSHYRRIGSASYRSESPRFGSSVELAMHGAKQAENFSLGAEQPNMPCLGLYGNVERDVKGTYWATGKKTQSMWNYPAVEIGY